MRFLWQVIERILVALGVCVVAIAISVSILLAPPFTSVVTKAVDVVSSSGLSPETADQVAQHVRRFVVTNNASPLPAKVDGRSGFDASAVSHLEDVRELIATLRWTAAVILLALLTWFVVGLRRRRHADVASALRWGALTCLGAPLVLAALGLADFDRLFTAFHGVFFDAGTWVFPADSLLIALFPEQFWEVAGASLAALIITQGVALWVAARAIGRRAQNAEVATRGGNE